MATDQLGGFRQAVGHARVLAFAGGPGPRSSRTRTRLRTPGADDIGRACLATALEAATRRLWMAPLVAEWRVKHETPQQPAGRCRRRSIANPIPPDSGGFPLAPGLQGAGLAMLRLHLWLVSIVLTGRHCHPLGLLVAGLIYAAVHPGGLGAHVGAPLLPGLLA